MNIDEINNCILFDFHTFERNGRVYLINIDRLKCFIIDKKTSRMLTEIQTKKGKSITLNVFKILSNYELLNHNRFNDKPMISKSSRPSKNYKSINAISLNISQRCNLNCIYCYGNGGHYQRKGDLNQNIGEKAISWLFENSYKYKTLSVNFFGGEPLINFNLLKHIVSYITKLAKQHKKRIKLSLTTNATLLDSFKIEYLKKHNIKVLVSFDGPKHIQNRNRPYKNGTSSYEDVVYNSKQLLRSVPTTMCRATYTDVNSIGEIKEEVLKVGFTTYSFSHASSSLLENYEKTTGSATHNYHILNKFIKDEASKILSLIKTRAYKRTGFQPLRKRIYSLLYMKKKRFGCSAGKSYLSVSIDGKVFPCHRFVGRPEQMIGTVNDKIPSRPVFFKRNVNQLTYCKKCWVRYFCGGGCIYENFSQNNNYFSPDQTYCKLMKTLAEAAIELFCELDDSDLEFLRHPPIN